MSSFLNRINGSGSKPKKEKEVIEIKETEKTQKSGKKVGHLIDLTEKDKFLGLIEQARKKQNYSDNFKATFDDF